jgi:hypothetical protein
VPRIGCLTWHDARPMRRAAVLAAALALGLAPGAARAQFAPLPPAQQQTQQTVVVPSNSDTGGLESWQEILIFAAGVIMLAGIGWAIVSDARSRAPVQEGDTHRLGGRGRPRRSEREKQRARARAKAARAQRKRSR